MNRNLSWLLLQNQNENQKKKKKYGAYKIVKLSLKMFRRKISH